MNAFIGAEANQGAMSRSRDWLSQLHAIELQLRTGVRDVTNDSRCLAVIFGRRNLWVPRSYMWIHSADTTRPALSLRLQ
jgi:hypothetical protein